MRGSISLGGYALAKRVLGFFLFICIALCINGVRISANYDLASNLPTGANILQVLCHPGFDGDDTNELLVLAEVHGVWTIHLLDATSNGYDSMYQADLGPADYLRSERIGETYSPLGTAEINGDGLMDFWVAMASAERSRGELRVYMTAGGTYRSVAEVNADYDIQFANYQSEWVIHSIDREPKAETLRLRSFVWERESERFIAEDEDYRISIEDYRRFSYQRKRPQLFSGKNRNGKLKSRWCQSLLLKRDIPRGRAVLEALLPNKAYLLDFLPGQDLDSDVDIEYLVAYINPDASDVRKVYLNTAVADWSVTDQRYMLKPLEGTFYGLARSAQGNFYQPIYLLKGNGLSHPIVVGNSEPDKPMIELMVFSNNGTNIARVDTFQANYSMQFKEHAANDGFYYQAILGNLTKDGKISVALKRSAPNNDEGACDPFSNEKEMVLTLGDFHRSFPAFEETEWISGGYETSILRTHYKEISAFNGPLPESQKVRTTPEEYLKRNSTALRIRDYWSEDFNNDGVTEALVLAKTDKSVWPPLYRLGYLRPVGDQLEVLPLGTPFQPSDQQPESGIYLMDISGDRTREIITIRHGINPETLRRGVNVEILGFQTNQWIRLHAREIWYDDLRLYTSSAGIHLIGFLAQSQRKTQGTVYEFLWRSEGFHLEKKISVAGFDAYLRKVGAEKSDLTKDNSAVIPMW